MSVHIAWVGLGSNLANPREQVELALKALDRLPLTRCLETSRLYASRPVGPQDQPDFVNAVARLETRLSPLALLDQLQALEQRHRRVRQRRWGPRTLDLDLLLFDDMCLVSPRLTIPHSQMTRRAFVMVPLAELAADRNLPDGQRIGDLSAVLASDDLWPVLPDA
ncbi:2-amino-4-hydroxy-6-hydroxymethyldihydropteridine diphosphokinase [Halomonas urumqiensis]|uniref:2-amino-4-hydroxy-6-hydroxymethyldihydropteridine pyrophosphokinase n=1 Tax=Halomonas urumqiensis TaxID=1684789 RepID=A0A2N7UL23_9GAMM|nr:2-amino-4-hydroxy-6-hydroxymethyldihydropteridine diphosphokinase [Halomonas urumqiensis]PMR81153.1 2-amino-4-hydroxy-6-hydroxymethyldihydropteridine diphosphokinase [Halomonas urumqiensis]PTB02475.1 2-amino-4-hydroxy-6-hydroxymethyldihydropteridine diphosphokinase [Halomonas urumqiensis]GHE20944.1 2-amino-4-hydroxy-6-hydroxymethyldihydropteridine pyrophosphokinase [Halomonas urumqiensis]